MELTGGEEGWSPASVTEALPDLPLLCSHRLCKSEFIFPIYRRGKEALGGVNPKSQRWDSNLGLGDLTGPLLTYMARLSTPSVSGPKTRFASQAALTALLSSLVQ